MNIDEKIKLAKQLANEPDLAEILCKVAIIMSYNANLDNLSIKAESTIIDNKIFKVNFSFDVVEQSYKTQFKELKEYQDLIYELQDQEKGLND